jgi:hypothetical protein
MTKFADLQRDMPARLCGPTVDRFFRSTYCRSLAH